MQKTVQYTFSEFINNYNTDLEIFLSKYPDATENDFKKELLPLYSKFGNFDSSSKITVFDNKAAVQIKTDQIPLSDAINVKLLAEIINKRVERLASIGKVIQKKSLKFLSITGRELFDDSLYNMTSDGYDQYMLDHNYDEYLIKYCEFEKYREFFESDDSSEKQLRLIFNETKFNNFEFAWRKIISFLLEFENLDLVSQSNTSKININGSTQLLGHIFNLLISGGYIEPKKNGNGEINKTGTARLLLDHFQFSENESTTSVEYLKKAIFDNSFGVSKADHIKIRPLKDFD